MSTKKTAAFVKFGLLIVALLTVCLYLHTQSNRVTVFRFSKIGTSVTETSFISRTTQIAMSAPAGAKIYYTTDGRVPDENADIYEEAIALDPSKGVFPKCLLLKAAARYADGSWSEVLTHTFFAHTEVDNAYQGVVVSLSGDPAQLTEAADGILYGENVWLRGAESEREIYVEAFSPKGNLLFRQNAGARVYGMLSRRGSIQSLKLYARKDYDKHNGKFKLDTFGSLGYDEQVIDRYDRLVLRNSSNSEYDFWCGFLRDELNQMLVEQAGYKDYQRVLPAVAYLNGEYYGFFWLHENICDDLLKEKYGGTEGRFEIIEGKEQEKIADEADPENVAAVQEFNDLYNKLAYTDLTDDANFAELNRFVDVENYLKYYAYNIYVNNVDWPHNNYKCYRYYAADDRSYGEGELDGRWRFLFHDLDFTMGNYGNAEASAEYNIIQTLLSPTDRRYSPLFANLVKREDCRDFFLSQIIELQSSALSPQNVIEQKNTIVAERANEMNRFFVHLQSLESSTGSVDDALATYEKSHQRIEEFIAKRSQYLQMHLVESFGLEKDYFD